jgi:hypothetical protein
LIAKIYAIPAPPLFQGIGIGWLHLCPFYEEARMKNAKMKSILLSISLLLILSLSSGTVYAYDSVVTGQNNDEVDVKAVQEAVDKGGTVLLKGAFNFGQKGQVNIKNDVEVIGESDGEGRPLTKISGGFWTFHSPLPTTELPLPGPGPKMKIKNIHFDGATWAPLHIPYTSGAEITGNKITNVHPFPIPLKWQGGEKLLIQDGVILGTRFAHKEKILPGAVSGHLIVENNKIDLKCKNPKLTLGHAIFLPWTWGATIEIKRNRIRNASRNSIETLDNYLDEEGRGSVLTAGIPFPSPNTPNGIIVGWFFDRSGGSDPSKNSKITVIRNYVQANGQTSGGIVSIADGTAILGNRVEVGGGPKAGGIAQLGSNAFIARNKIDGAGAHALRAVPLEGTKADGNTFAWNDVSEFKAAAADILCVGNKNTFVGASCKLDDKGKANKMLVMY